MLYDPSRPRAEPSFENLPVFQIYDVAPTVLAAFGLPVPSDMIGKSRAYHTA